MIMAIRLRKISGNLIAFCAAKTPPHPDDLYLDDEAHHALTVKFEEDFVKMGFMVKKEPTFPPMPKCKSPRKDLIMNQECSFTEKQSLQPISNIERSEQYYEMMRYLHEHYPIAGDHCLSITERVDGIIKQLQSENKRLKEELEHVKEHILSDPPKLVGKLVQEKNEEIDRLTDENQRLENCIYQVWKAVKEMNMDWRIMLNLSVESTQKWKALRQKGE